MEMVANDEDNMNNNNNIFNEINDQDWILEKPISVFALDPADRRVLKVADQRDAVQKKTFTKWINFHLSKREGLHVDDLFLDLRDGHILISLLEIFTNQFIPRERGTSKFHALQNIEQCLQCLEQDHNIRLVNIRPEELVNGNPKLTLGLIWRIILHFQFSDINLPITEEHIPISIKPTINPSIPIIEPTTTSSEIKPVQISSISSTTQRKSSIDQISSNYRNMLLIWARQQCQGYPGIYIDNFTHSWRNGRAFLAILHRHNPQLINIKDIYRQSNRENLIQAFDFAQKHYGIMQLIDPEDVDTDEPDEKSILLYIAHLYKVCSTLPIHPFQQEHDRIHIESELSNEYINLASDLLKWIKTKIDFLNSEIKFKNLNDIQTYEHVLQVIRYDEMKEFNQILHRMRSIDAEFETLQFNEILQPDIESINLAWNKLELTMNRVEYDLKQFLEQYEKNKNHFENDLDLIERDIANIERFIQIKSRQFDIFLTINQLNDIQIKLDQILNNCRTLSLPYEQIQSALERIEQLNLRIDNLHIQLTPSSTVTTTNGYHHSSKRQARSTQPSNFFTNSPLGIEQLDVIVTGDYRRSGDSQQQQQTRSNTMVVDSSNETKAFVLVDELHLINKNLNTLSQLLQQRMSHLLQTGLPTSNNDLLQLYQDHKEFENDLLSQASRIQDIRNHVRQDYNSSSHQELRSLVNQTSDHVQDLFTTSKNYSDKLDIADTALSLVTDLTSHIIELETRLASHTPLIDDETYIHRQLDDLNELDNHLQTTEKSIKELLNQSKQLGNERLIRISEQLALRWKQINTEINQRKRSIKQCIETHRSFETLYEQEELILDNLQRRMEALEPVSNDANKLRQMGKTVTDLFNEILSRAQSIENMNDVAVKFIEETKMHDKNLKRFRVSLRDLHPSLDASVSIIRRQYPTNIQRASRAILYKIEVFDRRYADLLANMEEYTRLFVKTYNATGQTINLPLDSASTIVHLYRSTIASRYSITLQSLLSSDDDGDEQQSSFSPSSSKRNRHNNNNNNNKTGFIDLSRGKVTVDHHHHHNRLSSLDGSVSFETTYVIPSIDNETLNNKKVRFIVQKPPISSTTTTNGNIIITSTKTNEMTQRKTLSFVDAVNNKHLDLSTGLFSSPFPFVLSSSSFSSSTITPDQHRHPSTHFSSSSSSPPQTTITTTDNKNLITSSVSANNHPPPVGADSATTITLKEAIDANILDAHSAYVVDTLEQRNYDLHSAYSRGLITSTDHRIIDRAKNQPLSLADALKMGILKVGDPQSYNIISKTESLVISSVYDHRLDTYIDPNSAIRKKILDPYHGTYLNNLTQETISIDDAMNKNFIIVQQQSSHPHSNQQNDKYVISTSLIRETRSYHLLGVRDYINNKELTVQEAIRLGILDKQNGQYFNKKTNEILSISEAIAQGHIRAQPLPVDAASSSTTTAATTTTTMNTQEKIGTSNIKRGTVKETKTYTLKSAIHPKTRKEIPIRQAIDEGIIDHAKGFYVNSLTGETLPISVAIEKGLIFTELVDQHSRRFAKILIIDQVIDSITNRRLGVTEAIQTGLLNSTITIYNHAVKQRPLTILEAYEQGLIIGKFADQQPSSFIGDQHQQTFYLINSITDIRTDKVYNLQDAIEQRLFDRRKGVYIHPVTNDEISIGDAVKRGFIQIQAVSSQIVDQTVSNNRSNISVRIDTHPQPSSNASASRVLQREKDIIEIKSVQRVPRHRRHHHTTTEEEIIEQHTTNVIDKEIYINRGRSSERPRREHIEEIIITNENDKNKPGFIDIKQEKEEIHEKYTIDIDRPRPKPKPSKEHHYNGTYIEKETHIIQPSRPQPSQPQPKIPTTYTEEWYDEQQQQQQSWSEEEWEQWHAIMMIKDKPYRVVWVMNTATGDRLPLQNAYQRGLVDTKKRLFFDEKLHRQAYSFEKAVELGYMGIELDTASLPIRVDSIDYMIHWVLDSSTKRRIFPRQAITKRILDATHGRYINPYNQSEVSLHEAIHLKFIGATEYGTTNDTITVIINGQTYHIKWVYDTVHGKKILPRDALRQGILDIQLNEYRKLDTKDVMTIPDAIQIGYIRCTDDESSSDNSIRPPSIISVDEDELTIATKTATYVITSVIHPLSQKEIKVSEAIECGILDKDTGSYRDLVTNVQYELAEAINEGLVYATIIETKEDTEMMTSSVQEIVKKFIVKSVALDSDSQEKIGGLEAQAVGILNYAQGVYNDRKYGVKIPLDKAIERKLLDVELVSQKKFEEYDLELITDTITEKRITLYKIHGVQNNVLGRMESGAIAVKNQMIDTENKTYTDFSTGENMSIQEAINRNLIQAEISEHVERKPLGLSMQNAIRLGFYIPETGIFRDPATEHYMSLMEAIERGHIHVNGVAFADSEQGPITLYDAFSLGLINRRDGGKLNPAKMSLYRAKLVESKLHRMNVEDAIRCGLLNLRTGLYKHPHSGEQLNLKEAIQRGLIDGQSTVIENSSTGRFMTLKDALDGIRIDHEGQVVDLYSNKVITTLELAFNHRKLFSQFDVNAGEIFLPSLNESVGFEKAVRKNLLDNNRIKLFDPKTSREYSIQDAIERGLIDHESGLVYDSHSRTPYSIRESIRHGIIAIVGAPLVPIKADHETVAAKITSRNRRRHSLAKSSLHFDYNSAPDSADEDSHGSGGWHRIASKTRAISPLSADGKRSIRRRTGSSPSRNKIRFQCRDDDWRTGWKGGNNRDDDDDDDTFGSGGGSRKIGGNSHYTSTITTTTSRAQDNNDSSNRPQNGRTSSNYQQNQQKFSNLSPVVNIKDSNKNELLQQKSEISYFVPPNTQVSNERILSPKSDIISDEDDTLLHPLITTKTEKSNHEEFIQTNDNQVIHDMHDVAGRLTSLHDQLNQYVYLTDNLNELRTNVQQIKILHSDVEKEKSTINNLIERTNHINPQLATLTQDLEEKRIEISDINSGLSNIIERFINQVDQFNKEHTRLIEWIQLNNKEIQKHLQLSKLENDNEKLKIILNSGINLENDLKTLQEHLQLIDLTIQDFEQATGNSDGGKSANIYKQLQENFDNLSINYLDFLKRCKQISDQCEHYMITYNEIKYLNEQILQSMNEFDQNLTSNENKQQKDNKLQILLLNVQQQLDKLSMLATHEPTSPSPIMSSNNHIQNQIREHLYTLLDSHTQRYNDAQQGLMHNLELFERYNHERQTIKEHIEELKQWLLSYIDHSDDSDDLFSKSLSLKRSKLDEQIIEFRQFYAQLRTHHHSYDTDINTTINLEQLLDNNDKKNLKLIEQYFHLLDKQANQYNERINRLSTRLNEFHLEHAHLIENYSKRLRLYSEHIEQNDDINFSALELLLNNDNETLIDHEFYEQLIRELIETDNIEDEKEIFLYQNYVNNYKKQYENFQNDLKLILLNRQTILDNYENKKNFLQDWLNSTDRLLKQYPNELTLISCENLLNQHLNMPIEQIQLLNQQLIQFYSSTNLFNLFQQLKLDKNYHQHSNITMIFQRQTDELIENYILIKEKILQYMEILNQIQQQTNKYQIEKDKAENMIEKAKELVTLEENTILPLDNQQIEIMLQKYKDIADQFKRMSSTIDEYKTIGLGLVNTAERYIDTEPIQNEITSIDKSWSEYIEYILDTIDYIQLHQEDLHEFEQLSKNLIDILNEKQTEFEQLNDNDLKNFHQNLEKYYEQIELLNQKGELLLQSSATNLNDDHNNQIENLLEIINRNYDSLTTKTKVRLENIDHIQQPITEQEQQLSSPLIPDKLADELHHHIEETDLAMNELSQLLVSSTTDIISIQPIKLSEQLLDTTAVQSELEQRKLALDQLHSNIETLKQITTNSDNTELIKALDEKLALLNEHWLIMKQANDLRTENLLLIQTCANNYWSQHNELSTFLNNLEKQLIQIRPRSTSREHIQREKEKYNQLLNEFSNQQIKYQEILEQHSSQLLAFIFNNPEESEDIQHSLDDLQQNWNRIQINLKTYENELEQAMIESTEFNSKLERVSTWFDDTSFSINLDKNNNNNEFQRIRTFKEHLDCKYLDIINLKQDYTDIEQHKQQDDQHDVEENDKTNLVEQQLINIDTKWTQLNDQIQEHKTLVYETALRQNRIDDVIGDITQSLDDCSSKLSVLITNVSDLNLNDMKQIEISIGKLRILLNDIELISYDIEQLKQNSLENPNLILLINQQWEELLKQATDKYNSLENKLEQMKLKQKLIDHIYHKLDLIDKQVNENSINTKFPLLIEHLEHIEDEINQEFSNDDNNNNNQQQIEELKKRLIDVKQRTLTKGQELIELAHSIELFHTTLQKFTEWLTETERYLNNQKPVQRRFGLIQTLLKQIDDHKIFQIQLQTYKEHLIDLDKLATHLKFVSPKNDSIYIRNSLIAVQTRWQKILTRTTERTKELQKAFEEVKKDIRPEVTDIDRIKSEVNRQASLCTCSQKFDVQQVAEGRYRFGESQSLRLVRILRSTVMVRVGGGWTALDEFLVRHDPCRAKGRTNYELHPESYALRDGVAQTMTLFKPRLVTVHRPTCLYHQQQLAASGTSKQSPVTTPNRGTKDKSRRTSSIISLTQRPPNSSSIGDLSASGDDLSTSPHVLSDSEARPSHIPVPVAATTPVTSTLSRTSSRESVLSEHSIASTSSTQQRRPSKLPLPVSRQKKATSGSTPVKNS